MEAQVCKKEVPVLKEEIDDIPLSELWKRMHKSEPELANGKKEHKKKEVKKVAPSKIKRTLTKVCGNSTSSKKKKVADENEEKLANKKFSKPGQRREPPPKGDPLRLFYESMYEEKKRKNKEATLAETWLLIHGLLDEEQAKVVFEKQRKAKVNQNTTTKQKSRK
ncbi:uncharacterized protein Gasu_48750 [Galdieria sulphuraria]|uniref:Uncharacterized protein n=1 Tax=Galdieria sulphuraria TaxID=130081 RepID=M2WUG9_GALSU|nr:uncharacterized protein Gasu_48750 [Galdieria sulphuraria]EME27580.1 hypothetical protein Gasu_48750 [Galdieria sulphuraria]|eukprot:XP_005704100.1 hypothetical protein Gasu_48750 [Galdieria sulphuraria]